VPKPHLFHYAAFLVVVVALAAAVTAFLAPLRWSLALLSIALMGTVATIVLYDRRTQRALSRK
jgi:hypothetical protein